jgi:hypothetical protein
VNVDVVGELTTASVVPTTVAATPEFVNVTCTDDAVPGRAAEGVPDPITTTTVVALAYAHDVASVPVLGVAPTLAVHTNPAMKFAPVTVMVLLAYAEVGAMEAAVGLAMTVSVIPETVATLAPFVSVTCTDDAVPGRAAEGVPDPITTTTVVALAHAHDVASVPVLGVAPTLAVHTNPAMKLVPVTVMVLLAYAEVGAMESAVGAPTSVRVVPATVAALAPFVNVTSTVPAPAVVSAPITATTVVALAHAHDVTATVLTMAVHTNPAMKLVPVTVMVLLAYAEVGAMESAVGAPTSVRVVPATVAVLAITVNVTCTDDAVPGRAAEGVPAPITTTTVVALAYVHDVASVPELGVAPTLAVQAALFGKFSPVTVMVLPVYAEMGAIDVAVGSEMTVSVVPATVATLAPFVNVTCTDDAAAGVFAPITTTTCVPLGHEHDAAAVLVVGTLLPTRAVHANPEMKLVPVTVMVLPTDAEVGAMEVAVGFPTTLKLESLLKLSQSLDPYGSKHIFISQPLVVAAVVLLTTTVAVVALT